MDMCLFQFGSDILAVVLYVVVAITEQYGELHCSHTVPFP